MSHGASSYYVSCVLLIGMHQLTRPPPPRPPPSSSPFLNSSTAMTTAFSMTPSRFSREVTTSDDGSCENTTRKDIEQPNDSETTQKLDKDVCACTYTTKYNYIQMDIIILDKIHTQIREGSGHCTEQNQCSRNKKLKLHQYDMYLCLPNERR